jgi:enoyl-CoA hydratase/carnithine racemase
MTEPASSPTVLYSAVDGVATITLNRPEKLNTFNPEMHESMVDAFDRADADDGVRAVVVTGAGRGFCAGADLSAGRETFDYTRRGDTAASHRDLGGMLALRVYRALKPVIAAMNGSAVGVGVTMRLPMDIRILADDAKLGFVFARRGIVPDGAASWFLPRVVGVSQALEWCLTGRVFGAEEALAGGLVRTVCPADEVLPRATALAREIAVNSAPVSRCSPGTCCGKCSGRSIPWRPTGPSRARSTTPGGRPTRRKASPRSWRSGHLSIRCARASTCPNGSPGAASRPLPGNLRA